MPLSKNKLPLLMQRNISIETQQWTIITRRVVVVQLEFTEMQLLQEQQMGELWGVAQIVAVNKISSISMM